MIRCGGEDLSTPPSATLKMTYEKNEEFRVKKGGEIKYGTGL